MQTKAIIITKMKVCTGHPYDLSWMVYFTTANLIGAIKLLISNFVQSLFISVHTDLEIEIH